MFDWFARWCEAGTKEGQKRQMPSKNDTQQQRPLSSSSLSSSSSSPLPPRKPWQAPLPDPRTFDNETFRLGYSLVKRSKPLLKRGPAAIASRLAAAVMVGAGAWHVGPLTSLQVCCSIPALAIGFAAHNEMFPERAHKLSAKYIPWAMKGLDKALSEVRMELLKGLRGKVLDVGCATGLYLKYAKGKHIDEYVALEPNVHMHDALRRRAVDEDLAFAFRTTDKYIQDLVHEDGESGTYDSIILGNVLCEVPDIDQALTEAKRLLKPGGRLYYSEHVLDDDNAVRRFMQKKLVAWWRAVSDGCHCDRRTLPKIINTFGNDNVANWTVYVNTFPLIARFEVGVAVKR